MYLMRIITEKKMLNLSFITGALKWRNSFITLIYTMVINYSHIMTSSQAVVINSCI
jgi:hypothetical protein